MGLTTALLIAVGVGTTTLAYSQDQEVTPAQLKELKSKIGRIDQWLRKAEQDRSTLEQSLANADQAINRLTRERRDLQARAQEQTQRLAELKKREAELTRTLDRQRESLRQQIREAWMAGDAPAIKILLNEMDPQKISRTMTYYEYLSQDTLKRLQAFHANLNELQQTQAATIESQTKLTELESGLAERQQELRNQKRKRTETLTALKARIQDRQSERESLNADRERLEQLLREVEEAIAAIPSPNESKPFKALQAKLPWPARGKVARSYGESVAQGKLRHNGMLITTDRETDVAAVHYGRVVFANWLRGFGLMTIIDHGDGYLTLYGHNSSLMKSPGDWVSAGETIAVSGQSGGTNEPSVYFELRYKGKPQNPKTWLRSQ
ncbi:murein hydrolase activator EnvC family protein [Marinobacter salicampi]|uniref:murein hydrolase activator EnvC family protein n=1 Tax=Marinobacter salicampi TaxID=435907 RepID=UPI001F5E6384|nr:peptidoglycan DD-metalloendopeptidase family protein [Marinobacter salicampi]